MIRPILVQSPINQYVETCFQSITRFSHLFYSLRLALSFAQYRSNHQHRFAAQHQQQTILKHLILGYINQCRPTSAIAGVLSPQVDAFFVVFWVEKYNGRRNHGKMRANSRCTFGKCKHPIKTGFVNCKNMFSFNFFEHWFFLRRKLFPHRNQWLQPSESFFFVMRSQCERVYAMELSRIE